MDAQSNATRNQPRFGRRLRRVAKWTGLVSCGLIVGIFAATLRWQFVWSGPLGSEWRTVLLNRGSVAYGEEPRTPDLERGRRPTWGVYPKQRGLNWSLLWESLPPGFTNGIVPLWMPFLALAIPTAALWYFGRRSVAWRRMGLCPSCGYDLRGLPAGSGTVRCPECGREAVRTA